MKKWYKLNNVGKFYASTANIKNPKVFRYSAILKDNIDKDLLQEALDLTVKIYPTFNVNLKKGLFWYYLDESKKRNRVVEENLPICFRLYKNEDDFLYRVVYYKKKIILEVSHALSDGRGTVDFFKLLLTNYINIKYKLNIKIKNKPASLLEKSEDSFLKYYCKTNKKKVNKEPRYLYKGKKYRNQIRYMECHMSVNDILDMAHKYETTLTGLLVSILIYSFKDELKLKEMDKYIKILIPVDLRSYNKSNSAMNYFGVTNIAYKFNSKNDTLEDIIKVVNKEFKIKLSEDSINNNVNRLVELEKNVVLKFVPVFVKNLVLNIVDRMIDNSCSTCLSNIGIIKLDSKVEDYVESISVLISTINFQFVVCTLKDDLSIGISSRFVNNDVIKNFCRYFSNNNIDVRIDVSEVM